jgi:hypothetical protein
MNPPEELLLCQQAVLENIIKVAEGVAHYLTYDEIRELHASVQEHGTAHEDGRLMDHLVGKILDGLAEWKESNP